MYVILLALCGAISILILVFLKFPLFVFTFLLGIFFAGPVIILIYNYRRAYFYNSTLLSSSVFRYLLLPNGLMRYRKKVLKYIPSLHDYQVFFLYNDKVEMRTHKEVNIGKEEKVILESITQKALKTPYIVPVKSFLPFMHSEKYCTAYAYDLSFFNKRVLILIYTDRKYIRTPLFNERLGVTNDIVSLVGIISEFSRGNHGLMKLLKESVLSSPYAVAVCNPMGDVVFGNDALYTMFYGSVPNMMGHIGAEVYMLLLDGKRIGQSFNLQGRRIQVEGSPLSNKNFLITNILLVFYDEQVEFQREMLGEANSLRRFTSGSSIVGAAMFTQEGIILYSNEAFMRSLDVFKVREAKQKDIYELFYLTAEYYEKLVETVMSGKEHRTALVSKENEQEFQVLFKGVVFGDKTIIEVVLEGESIYQNNMSLLDKETQDIYEELQTARSVQEHILSLPTIYRPGVAVDTLYIPSRQLSGDFFTLIPFEDDQMGFLIADVSGHGVSASLITAALKILIEFAPKDPNGLPKIMSYFNTYLADILPEGSFVTLFYGIIDYKDYTLRYINCGHPFPIIQDTVLGETRILEGMGYPLGGLLNVSFEDLVYTIQLPSKCKIFLYTDGILQHLKGSMKDKLQKISSLIQTQKAINEKDMLQNIYQRLISRNSPIPEDDVSMMLVSLDKTQTKKHHLYVSSTILEADAVITEIGSYIQKEANLDPGFYWKIHTCFYEALLNAVVHGNKYNTQRKVYIEFRIVEGLIVIRIRDEGNGFDYNHIPDPFDPENILKDFGRGITMVRTLADKVKFNEKGNEVTMFFKTNKDDK